MKKIITIIVLFIFIIPYGAYSQQKEEMDIPFILGTVRNDLAVIFYGIGAGQVEDINLFSKWLLMNTNEVSKDEEYGVARKILFGREYYYLSNKILKLKPDTISFMEKILLKYEKVGKETKKQIVTEIQNNKEWDGLISRYFVSRFSQTLNPYLVDSRELKNFSVRLLLRGTAVLSYYTGAGLIPHYIKFQDRTIYGYNALILYALSQEDKMDKIGGYMPVDECVFNIDSIVQYLVNNSHIDTAGYEGKILTELRDKKPTLKDLSAIEKQFTKEQKSAMYSIFNEVCKPTPSD